MDRIGNIRVGDAAITPGFELNAKYVIHAVGPVWLDGSHDEEKRLRACYQRSLKLEMEQRVLDIRPDAVMLRAEWRYDIRSPKPTYILNILRATDRVAFRSGQYRGVTYVVPVYLRRIDGIVISRYNKNYPHIVGRNETHPFFLVSKALVKLQKQISPFYLVRIKRNWSFSANPQRLPYVENQGSGANYGKDRTIRNGNEKASGCWPGNGKIL